MKVTKQDSSQERRILTGMIVSRAFLARIASKWEKGGLFRTKWCNLIGGWCVKFFRKYDKAPRSGVQSLFEEWAENRSDRETVDLIERFLARLSGEYKALAREINLDHLTDMAGEHFNRVRLEKLAEEIQADIEAGESDKATGRVSKFSHIELGAGAGIDVMFDHEAIREAFEAKADPIVKYPGDLGRFFGDALERDGFICFMGPEKRGKTWWLIDLAWRAMLQRRRVAFFEVGDMSQNQIMRRLMVRASNAPLKAKTVRYPTELEKIEGEESATPTHEDREYRRPLSVKKAVAACKKVMMSRVKSQSSYFKLSVHPNSSISVDGIRSVLETWERDEEWVPDVIVIDYADILAPLYAGSTMDSRDQINATWKALRALSQSRHCLVVTATQAKASSYTAHTVSQTDFSEDKRKFAHVTGMIGLNATPAEKENGIIRVNWIVLREDDFIVTRCCHVAGCLDVGQPAIRSTF